MPRTVFALQHHLQGYGRITLLLLLFTELPVSHWFAANAGCVVQGCPTTLCIGA